MAKKGEWLGIGGASSDGWGAAPIEVRVSTGGVGWQWMVVPGVKKEHLLKLINDNPDVRELVMATAKPAPSM